MNAPRSMTNIELMTALGNMYGFEVRAEQKEVAPEPQEVVKPKRAAKAAS